MRVAGTTTHGLRTRALVVVLWRAGLRISEALALAESDFDKPRGSIVVRCGKGGKRRHVGMDRWAWEQVGPWLEARLTLPVGALLVRYRRPDGGTAMGHRQRLVRHCEPSPYVPACAGASPHISSDTPTPSRWPAKECR